MKHNRQLAYAISTVLSAYAGASVAADTAPVASGGVEEIIVTAQRRTESVQNVPITIQAVTGDQLKQLNVITFEDLLKYTPNVTFSGNGPGTGNIFMRGLSSGGSGNQSQSTTAPMPNVALYLDDQSMQFPARNNEVYLVDMERVEILEGPQGTLFGGGAQAGAVRYITNKPKLNVTEGNVNAGYGITAGGDPNSNLNAVLNLPLIQDTLAIRGVFFEDRRGGYISNVPGTIQLKPCTNGVNYDCPVTRPGSPEANNGNVVGNNTNPVDYQGFRLSALWQMNDDWSLLLQQNYQNSEADGYFSTEPVSPGGVHLGANQIVAFEPSWTKDKYESTAWTLNGKLGDYVKAVYTGSYMTRHIDGQQDYSNYLTSAHGAWYDCSGAGAGYAYFRSAKPTTCAKPVGAWRDQVTNTHQSHELRFTIAEDKRIRATVGGYWEKFVIYDVMNFNYMPIPQCDAANLAVSLAGGPDCAEAVGPVPGYFASDPSLRLNTNTAFGEDVQRGYKQLAEFASVDIDIVPKVLTLTVGTRHYKYDEFETGSEYYSATSSILNVANGTPYGAKGAAAYGFGMNLKKSESGFRSRANLTWHITPDMMAYYTFSQGFRPGGFNRTSSSIDGSTIGYKAVAPYSASISGSDQFLKPVGYNSDNLINNEVGFKSEFFNHRVQLNVSAYQMDWKDVQLPLFDPSHLGNTTFDVNGPTYRVKGAELQLVARVTDGLTLQGSASWNSSEQTNAPCLASSGTTNPDGSPNKHLANNPTPKGQCITQINDVAYTNPYGVLGTSPAFSPPLMFNVRAKYDWLAGDFKAFAWVGANHVASMRNEPASFPDGTLTQANGGCLDNTGAPTTTLCKYEIAGYTTWDAAIGLGKDNWTAQLAGSNLTNSDASTNISSGQFLQQNFPLRPRVLTVQIGYKF